MTLPKTYSPTDVEDKWYKFWTENGFFNSDPNPEKEPYCIVIPPPNITGVLHMGHMLNNTIQDVLIRKARMEGKEACWVPGTDHASIATEAKVVNMLQERGIKKEDISREEFLSYAWEWKEKYGGIILEQLKKLGASCDWRRTRFTMEKNLSEAVTEVFVELYQKGHIYRGIRMVNWDPERKTAVSDEEVNHKEVNSKLYYIKYKIVGEENEFVTIATTRPETILADTAVCVNPTDVRYKHLHGKKALIPFVNREVPIIVDDYVSTEFGTGCLKVTPAHDLNDYELGLKHKLPVIDILNDDGTLNEKAEFYVGEDRFAVREKIAVDLEEKGFLVKTEDYITQVGFSERTDAVIEPRLSMQWFLKMEELSKPALENVMNDTIRLYPSKFKNLYKHWMENVKDWCISRQLWWGQRIPAWHLPDGDFVVAETAQEALDSARKKTGNNSLQLTDLQQDEDVLDTWFSSWLWPISVFDGFKNPDNDDINYYYPTNDLITAPDILFFWVARMIIAGYEFKGKKPFQNVYLTGIIRDKQRRKMSKSLGNSPEPLDLIAEYGADGVRAGMLLSSPAGNDLLFDEKLCEQGRNFCNKIWNAFRLVNGWEVIENENTDNDTAVEWFDSVLNTGINEIHDHFSKFRISDALMVIYKLIRDDFCSRYLEIIKPVFEQPIDGKTYRSTVSFFEKLTALLHPFMPFISEEIWQNLYTRKKNESICISEFPSGGDTNPELIQDIENVFNVISELRNGKASKQISPKKILPLSVKTTRPELYNKYQYIIKKAAGISEIMFADTPPEPSIISRSGADELYLSVASEIDPEKEKEHLLKEIAYTEGFLSSISKKLSNDRFVQNAPADVVDREQKKKADAEAKLKSLKASLN